MLFQLALALCLASCFIEWMLYYNFPRLVDFIVHGKRWLNIVFSLGLSALLGVTFGAEGVTIMIAGVCSTALSPLGIPVINWLQDHEDEFPEWRAQAGEAIKQGLEALKGTIVIFHSIVKAILAPTKVMEAFSSKMTSVVIEKESPK